MVHFNRWFSNFVQGHASICLWNHSRMVETACSTDGGAMKPTVSLQTAVIVPLGHGSLLPVPSSPCSALLCVPLLYKWPLFPDISTRSYHMYNAQLHYSVLLRFCSSTPYSIALRLLHLSLVVPIILHQDACTYSHKLIQAEQIYIRT